MKLFLLFLLGITWPEHFLMPSYLIILLTLIDTKVVVNLAEPLCPRAFGLSLEEHVVNMFCLAFIQLMKCGSPCFTCFRLMIRMLFGAHV